MKKGVLLVDNIDIERYYNVYAATLDTTVGTSGLLYYELFKRIFDIIFSIFAIVITIPIMILFSILISLESPGSPIYRQKRAGLGGKCFRMFKLRSMYMDAEKNGAIWAKKDDDRVTKVGSFIRRTRIDEIPQFLNVLKGEMSLIGPRPERPIFIYQFSRDTPKFLHRMTVKPGITGWAQVNGGYELSPSEKLEADLYYIEHKNFLLDFKIILKTVKIVLTGDGAR
jgi:exopolysaccharide biosynthesis polyprenyl glycosylphosphotransferase